MDSAGNVIVTGGAMDNIGGQENIYNDQVCGADGGCCGRKRYDGPTSGEDEGTAVAWMLRIT